MQYFDNLNPRGATIDGKPDAMETGLLSWQFVTGRQGSMTMALHAETNIPTLAAHSYYFDQAEPDWAQGVGDSHAYAASGPATGSVPNTDPARGDAYRFVTTRTIYFDPPNQPLGRALQRVAAARIPLQVKR